MSIFDAFSAIVRVGFLNRVRSYRFLVTLLLCIVAGYVFVPAPDAGYVTLGWESESAFYRGVYNSAWIGSLVALLTGVFLALFGFYVVNDVVRLDEDSGVGQVIASAPVSNPVYTLGCAVSNFLVLACMVFIVALTALGMQFVRGEVFVVDLWALFNPFLLVVVPLIFLVASLAVFFETFPGLSRTSGNILYVFLWLFGIPILSESFDLFGINLIIESMGTAGRQVFPDLMWNSFNLGVSWGFEEGRGLELFTWSGMDWGLGVVQDRLMLMLFAAGVALLASLRFNRFDPASQSLGPVDSGLEMNDVVHEVSAVPIGELGSIGEAGFDFGLVSLFLAETRLMLLEFPSIGWLAPVGALVMFFGGLLLPVELVRSLLLPLAWLFPVVYWSRLGCREARHSTGQLVFSSAGFVLRQFLSLWLVGVLVSLVTGGGFLLRLVFIGDLVGALAVFVGALFVPSLALCLGVWTGSSKVFEFLYVLLWYVGPFSGFAALDFMGATGAAVADGFWRYYLLAMFVLIGLGYVGRKLQVEK